LNIKGYLKEVHCMFSMCL